MKIVERAKKEVFSMKKSRLVISVMLPALALAYGHGSESRAERAPSAVQQAAQPAPTPGASDHGKVVVTNRLDIDFSKHLVTFIELGADRCIPCKQMQPIMKEIAETYAGRIQVVFYDVWKDPGPARHYRIQLIPTQVFVDQKGNEIFRHVGLFPRDEILRMLKDKGIL